MTPQEVTQEHSAFIEAGTWAFKMMIPFQNNPNTQQPYKDLWEKGFRAARRIHDDKKLKERRAHAEAKRAEEKKGLKFPAKRNLVGKRKEPRRVA